MSQYQPPPGTLPSSFKSTRLETVSPNPVTQYQTTTPSGISLLLANRRPELFGPNSRGAGLPASLDSSPSLTPQPRNQPVNLSPPSILSQTSGPERPSPQLSEEAPLLPHNVVPNISYSSAEAGLSHPPSKSRFSIGLAPTSETACARSGDLLVTCVHSIPAVLLGILLNILDGVSCELFQEYPVISFLTWCCQMVCLYSPPREYSPPLGVWVSLCFLCREYHVPTHSGTCIDVS